MVIQINFNNKNILLFIKHIQYIELITSSRQSFYRLKTFLRLLYHFSFNNKLETVVLRKFTQDTDWLSQHEFFNSTFKSLYFYTNDNRLLTNSSSK